MPQFENHRQLLDNISTALLVLGTDLRVTYLNGAAQALLQISASRCIGTPLEQVMPLPEEACEELQKALSDQSTYINRSLPLRLPGGQETTIDLMISPYESEPRVPLGLILEFQTVDRIKRISREEGIVTSHETTQALVRGLAHEIKNPLGGLRGAAQLLAKELTDPNLEEYTNIIIQESDRLRDLVDRMLGPNRKPQPTPVNIHEILMHVQNLVEVEMGSKISFILDYDPSLPDFMADRSQLIQTVLNILRNAVTATETNEGDRIIGLRSRIQRQFTIGTCRHRLVCRVDISDNGPGIKADILHAIFLPMVSGRADGTGLGLAIAQSIINQHKGLIECTSAPGNTVFTLYIPLDTQHAKN
jgi:two-component system nitrogen regulation sensor histidine kinase GlnL